jgi:3-phenylpropionate/trans-cinnamate dioxygenase ferredoxin subunit
MSDRYTWHRVCSREELEEEDVIGVAIQGKSYAVYRISEGFFATDGLCTHEQSPLEEGFVFGDIIECSKHNARFHIPSGKALRKPALTDLKTYPVKVEGDNLFIGLPS